MEEYTIDGITVKKEKFLNYMKAMYKPVNMVNEAAVFRASGLSILTIQHIKNNFEKLKDVLYDVDVDKYYVRGLTRTGFLKSSNGKKKN